MYGFGIGISPSNRLFSGGGGGASYLLDTYGSANFAFSIRKLSSSYTGSCMRIRRSSDNAEQDIDFVSDYIDTASMLSFVGAGNGFVVKWYDQSGNVNDSLQTSGVSQPQIISSGSLVVSSENGKPIIYQNGNIYKLLQLTSTVPFGNLFVQIAIVDKFNSSYKYITTGGASSATTGAHLFSSTIARIENWTYKTSFTLSDTSIGEKIVSSYRKVDLYGGIYLNNSQQDIEKIISKPVSTSLTRLLNLDDTQGHSNLQEIVFWSQDYIADISDITTEVNNYYNIY
jgi:hypothetical protein